MNFCHRDSGFQFVQRSLLLAIVCLTSSLSYGQSESVNFSYSPAHYETVVCAPYDWLKTMISEQGALTYEYGPGPYARPLTEISVGAKEGKLTVSRQYLEDPRVPVVTTLLQGGGQTVRQEAYSLPPETTSPASGAVQDPRVKRLDRYNGCVDWATPPAGTDPAFRNVAWGTNRPIRYIVQVEPGSKKIVAMGLCESYKWGPKARIEELRVEGAEPLTVSTMKDTIKNRPYVYLFHASDTDGDGRIAIEAHASPKSPDPNIILNAFWVFPENATVTEDAVVRGELSSKAEVVHSCGTEVESSVPPTRVDVIHASFSDKHATPIVNVRTRRVMQFGANGVLRAHGSFYLFSRPKAVAATKTAEGWALELPEGTGEADIMVVHGSEAEGIPTLNSPLEKVRTYWLHRARVPRDPIAVPDSGIQYLLDASIRTIYQVGDIVDGEPQFQPGPTVYRGLWAGDAMLTGVSIMTLGDTLGARTFLETVLHHQLPSGQIRSLYPAVSMPETPAAVAAFCIYARSFGDSSWMRTQWPNVLKAVQWIEQMHRLTLTDTSARQFGLMPPSFVDGGIADETADYSTVWWTMVSLERVIDAAQWLGVNEDVPRWKSLLNEMSVAWRKAAKRDLAKDHFGNSYLPVVVGDTSRTNPQRGQFAFLCPFPYARFFQEPDPLLQTIIHGNLAMLDSTQQEGLVSGSGWVSNGVWPWLGGVHGIAHDLAGNPSRASELLYAFANHATPTGTWVEEQSVRTKGERTGGDVSDAEAAAVFIYHVRRLLVRERLDDLELLAGMPEAWLRAGSSTELRKVFTEFGPVSLRLTLSGDGSLAKLHLSSINGRGSGGRPVLCLGALKRQGFAYADGTPLPDRLAGSWGKDFSLQCKRNSQAADQTRR